MDSSNKNTLNYFTKLIMFSRHNQLETRLWLNSNFENHDIELKIQSKMKKHSIKTRKEKSLSTFSAEERSGLTYFTLVYVYNHNLRLSTSNYKFFWYDKQIYNSLAPLAHNHYTSEHWNQTKNIKNTVNFIKKYINVCLLESICVYVFSNQTIILK